MFYKLDIHKYSSFHVDQLNKKKESKTQFKTKIIKSLPGIALTKSTGIIGVNSFNLASLN